MEESASIKRWIERIDQEHLRELRALLDSGDAMLVDAFDKTLSFGTGGLRGKIGVGPNRMNEYTIGQVTQGLSDYLLEQFDKPVVAVCRDSRIMGREFVGTAVGVLAANGIKALVFPRVEPTPALSFAVRRLGCVAGINITASHNPAEYNGYKVYGSDGCQITVRAASAIQSIIKEIDIFDDVKCVSFDRAFEIGLAEWIDDSLLAEYVFGIVNYDESIKEIRENLSLVYSPLNGVGFECVSSVLEGIGIDNCAVVSEQEMPDGRFPTCPYPNPENYDAMKYGLKLCKENNSDLFLATDPDADRVGVAVRHDEDYEILTGNEVGILLLDWLCKMQLVSGRSLDDKVAVTTIVSSSFADALAEKYGFELRRTLTGFKYIGEQVGLLESEGKVDCFFFGFEESCGYLAGSQVRDKDGVLASMLICQMARWYKKQGLTLYEAMQGIYEELGFYLNDLVSVSCDGGAGMQHLDEQIDSLRTNPPEIIMGLDVVQIIDYNKGVQMPMINQKPQDYGQMLPPANVLEFRLSGDNKIIIRPSGTEPKAKAYVFAYSPDATEAEEILAGLKEAATAMLTGTFLL